MEIPVTCVVVFLLVFGGACCVDGRKEASNADSSKGDAGQKRPSQASENKPSRCSYTFIVPQQKLTGVLCVSTETARVNRSEMASLCALLDRQQEQLDTMCGQLEQESALANEMRVLLRESVNMNARITQLYAQLLNETIQKKDQEQRRLESLVLNATAQKGGWWYHMCAHSNLNGVWYRGGHYRSRYQDGVYWAEFHGGSYSLKKVAMMIKPA